MKTIHRLSVFVSAPLASLLLAACARGAEKAAANGQYFVYVGTYTKEKSKGIYAYRFNPAKDQLTSIGLVAETTNPSFLAVHPNRRFLYAVSEMANYEGRNSGAVSAFAIDPKTGKLSFLNKVSSRGGGPAFVTVDKTGKDVLVANYGGGSVAALPVLEDGRLGEASAFVQHAGSSVNAKRQQGPHAHSINVSPDNRFALVADLGLDQVLVYSFDPTKGSLAPNPPIAKMNPGAGPRHLAFHPSGRFVYVINEMQSSVTAFAYDAARGAPARVADALDAPERFCGREHHG